MHEWNDKRTQEKREKHEAIAESLFKTFQALRFDDSSSIEILLKNTAILKIRDIYI